MNDTEDDETLVKKLMDEKERLGDAPYPERLRQDDDLLADPDDDDEDDDDGDDDDDDDTDDDDEDEEDEDEDEDKDDDD